MSLAAIALLTASTVVGQRVYPSNSNNSNSGKKSNVATIRSADSSEGSRVSISSNQSLADYEAYKRGDKFYVKVPASDVARAEAVRGRGFADVSAQRSGSSTTLAFRLQPGSTAHVQQNGNRLDVVIAVAGNNSPGSFSRPRNFQWSDTSGVRSGNANNRVFPSSSSAFDTNTNTNKRSNQNSNKNSSARDNANSSAAANSNTKSKPGNTNSNTGSNNTANTNSSAGTNAANQNSSAGFASTAASPVASPSAMTSPMTNAASSGLQDAASPANSASPSPAAAPATARSDFWTRAKESGHYWLLLAQLNPVPVAIGVAILVLIIALLLMQRRRAKATRRVKTVTKSTSKAAATSPAKSVEDTVPVVAAVAAAAPEPEAEEVTETTRLAAVPPVVAVSENGRKERVSRAAEEANKVFTGQPYDESILGSEDRETRRMVGAELLSAMVGRNTERRDRARAAFMKHGYFDDATRDLRVAGSDNERAAAARRLSFVQDPEATPHLVGALSDSSPDVRRAAVEALMDQRDPAAIPALNNLLQSEKDRKVPRHLIEQAIEACATNSAPPSVPAAIAAPPPIDTDREVIEI